MPWTVLKKLKHNGKRYNPHPDHKLVRDGVIIDAPRWGKTAPAQSGHEIPEGEISEDQVAELLRTGAIAAKKDFTHDQKAADKAAAAREAADKAAAAAEEAAHKKGK